MRLKLLAILLAGACGVVAAQEPGAVESRLFMVFFDWSKPELRRDDEATLDRVATAFSKLDKARIVLEGHTDRSGSAATNRAAGLKRAAEVRDQLVKRGIAGNAIRLVSFGENRPLVPTVDGVREVQNRRVVIVFEE